MPISLPGLVGYIGAIIIALHVLIMSAVTPASFIISSRIFVISGVISILPIIGQAGHMPPCIMGMSCFMGSMGFGASWATAHTVTRTPAAATSNDIITLRFMNVLLFC